MRSQDRFKTLVISIILSIIIYFVYTTCRDIYIEYQNENYEVKEFVMDQNFEEIKE